MNESHPHPGHRFRRPNILAPLNTPTPYKATLHRHTEDGTDILLSDGIGSHEFIHLEAKHDADFAPQWDLPCIAHYPQETTQEEGQISMEEENMKSNKGRGEDVSFRRKGSGIARAQGTWKL